MGYLVSQLAVTQLHSDREGAHVKAVRSVEGGVAVVDVDEPPGAGELLEMRATSICGSDLSYIRFGSGSWMRTGVRIRPEPTRPGYERDRSEGRRIDGK
jgi:hypothetical protein